MKKAFAGLMLVLLVCTVAQATVIVTAASVPTPGLPGFQTVTVSMAMANGDWVVGYDGAFVGPMNQVNPFMMATIFQDNNTMFPFWPMPPGTPVLQDSQFLFKTTTADPINGVLTVGSAEGPALLDANFAMKGGRNNPKAGPVVAIAQLVVPVGMPPAAIVQYIEPTDSWILARGTVSELYKELVIPEPATLSLLALGAAALLRRRRS